MDAENPSPVPARLDVASLHPSLTDPALSSMNLLNQVANTYPDAVSFAAGRPYEGFFDVQEVHNHLRVFCDFLKRDRGLDDRDTARTVLQYGPTKGVIADLVATALANDEAMEVDPDAVVVTVGCQEAMFLVLRALRADERDVVLAPRPTYVGLTGAARLADLPVWPVRTDEENGLDLDDLVTQLRAARAEGKRVRACYVLPDFANPVGASMDRASRERLLDIARAEDLLLLEDNAYGLFRGAGDRIPTLKALDDDSRVVYLGSFAKTGIPSSRVGFVIADQLVSRDGGTPELLADELSKIKSMVTVNTSPLAQAVIGGKILAHGGGLRNANQRESEVYQRNMRAVLDGLTQRLGTCPGVRWNEPGGGFFVSVTVPFTVDDVLLEDSARRYGVLFTPMHHFYGGTDGFHQLRLSVSALTPELIEEGLDRLASLITDYADRSEPALQKSE